MSFPIRQPAVKFSPSTPSHTKLPPSTPSPIAHLKAIGAKLSAPSPDHHGAVVIEDSEDDKGSALPRLRRGEGEMSVKKMKKKLVLDEGDLDWDSLRVLDGREGVEDGRENEWEFADMPYEAAVGVNKNPTKAAYAKHASMGNEADFASLREVFWALRSSMGLRTYTEESDDEGEDEEITSMDVGKVFIRKGRL